MRLKLPGSRQNRFSMDKLWAIKRDFDPFPASFLINYNLLAIFRCTVFRCPYCYWIFKLTWGPSSSLLGSGDRACWHCDRTFWDGSDEWPEMTSKSRGLFLFPISICGYLGGFLVSSAICIYAVSRSEQLVTRQALPIFATLLLPLAIWFIFRWRQISNSIRRYNDRVPEGHS